MSLGTRTLCPIVVLSGIVLLAPLGVAEAVPPNAMSWTPLRVVLQPGAVELHQRATITVSGVSARGLEVRLAGATDGSGKELPWQRLQSVGSAWQGTLATPALRGVYPVLFRERAHARVFESHGLRLRVFNRGTASLPAFDRPIDVVYWWVRAVEHATLVAVKAWPRPAFDRRDRHLHRLFVVAYSPPGYPDVRDRLGIFITTFRDVAGARWRLLDASVLP